MTMVSALFTPTFIYINAGLIIWAVRFLAAYVFTALACARGWSDATIAGIGAVPAVVGLFTLLAAIGCVAILARAAAHLRSSVSPDPAAENARFIHYVAGSIAALGLLAVIWETLPIFMIPICA
jgi:hypothetical protein